MSILLDPPNLTRRTTPGKAGVWLAVGVLILIGVTAFAAAQLIPLAQNTEQTFWQELLMRQGPVPALRRILILVLAVLGPIILKRLGWSGLRDMGWNSAQTRGERKRDVVIWSVAGLGVSLVLGTALVLRGQAAWVSASFLEWIGWLLRDVLLAGILGTLLFESFARGVLYRTLAAQWTSWPAAVLVSIVLAWFSIPVGTPIPFSQGTFSVVGALLALPFQDAAQFQVFLSTALFGLILCRFVYHKGDIWGAVGLHASVFLGLDLFVLSQQETGGSGPSGARHGFYTFAASTPWFFVGLLVLWGWIEWRHRKKLTSYGRVHF